MNPQLPKELQQALAKQGDKPMHIVDPGTKKVYVLVSADLFDRIMPSGEETFEIEDTYEAQSAALAKVWDDPSLDIYANYDLHKGKL